MRSFALSAIATLAFGLFCSAAPTPSDLPTIHLPVVAKRDTPTPPDGSQTLQSVLTTAGNNIAPLAEQVANLKTVQAVSGVVIPILDKVKVILENTIGEVEDLADIPVEQALADVTTGVTLDVQTIVALVLPVVKVVLVLLQHISDIVTGAVEEDVLPLVLDIIVLLAQLLTAILALVGSLAESVVVGVCNQIQELIPFIMKLNVYQILVILGLSS